MKQINSINKYQRMKELEDIKNSYIDNIFLNNPIQNNNRKKKPIMKESKFTTKQDQEKYVLGTKFDFLIGNILAVTSVATWPLIFSAVFYDLFPLLMGEFLGLFISITGMITLLIAGGINAFTAIYLASTNRQNSTFFKVNRLPVYPILYLADKVTKAFTKTKAFFKRKMSNDAIQNEIDTLSKYLPYTTNYNHSESFGNCIIEVHNTEMSPGGKAFAIKFYEKENKNLFVEYYALKNGKTLKYIQDEDFVSSLTKDTLKALSLKTKSFLSSIVEQYENDKQERQNNLLGKTRKNNTREREIALRLSIFAKSLQENISQLHTERQKQNMQELAEIINKFAQSSKTISGLEDAAENILDTLLPKIENMIETADVAEMMGNELSQDYYTTIEELKLRIQATIKDAIHQKTNDIMDESTIAIKVHDHINA